jgi:hypothetical protein
MNIETFVELAIDNPTDVKVNKVRVTLGRAWVTVLDFEDYCNADSEVRDTAEEIVNEWIENPFKVETETVVRATTKPKENNMLGHVVMEDTYQGICHNPKCSGHSPVYIETYEKSADKIIELFRRINLSDENMSEIMTALREFKVANEDALIMPKVHKELLKLDTTTPEFAMLNDEERKLINSEISKAKRPLVWAKATGPKKKAFDAAVSAYWDSNRNKSECFNGVREICDTLDIKMSGWHKNLVNKLLELSGEGTEVYEGSKSWVVDIEFHMVAGSDKSVAVCSHCGQEVRQLNSKGRVSHLGVTKAEVEQEILDSLNVDDVLDIVKADLKDVKAPADESRPYADIDVEEILNNVTMDDDNACSDEEYNGYIRRNFAPSVAGALTSEYKDEELDAIEAGYLNSIHGFGIEDELLIESVRYAPKSVVVVLDDDDDEDID